jgi:hypothetical protein
MAKIIRITPPHSAGKTDFGRGSRSVGASDARRQGESKVQGDIRRVYVPLPVVMAALSPIERRKVAGLVKRKRYRDAESVLRATASEWSHTPLDLFDGGKLHSMARNRDGAVSKAARPSLIVVNPKELDRYIETRVRNVGLMASGFAPSLVQLGGSVARWIGRHGGGQGSAREVRREAEYLFIGIWSISWNRQETDVGRRVDAAIGYQINATVRALEAAMKKHGVTTK